jgi:hypothetical protein
MYVQYLGVSEDDQYDDLTIMGIMRKREDAEVEELEELDG